MKKIKFPLLLLSSIFLLACPSDDDNNDDCMKTITVPQSYWVNGQSYSYDTTLEVPCDFPEPSEPQLIEPPVLDNFYHDVLSFVFTPDTGNNTSRLQFEIELFNPNDFIANGLPVLTLNVDGIEITGNHTNYASEPCYQIQANSSCIFTYDLEESLNIGIINSIELVDVQYYLTN